MTAIAKAIVETPSLDALRLRALAYEILKASERDPRKAIGGFLAAVRSDRALLFELIGYAAARERAFIYLDNAASDMRNKTEGEEAHNRNERQWRARSSPSAPSTNAGEQHASLVNAGDEFAASPAPPSGDGDAHTSAERLQNNRSPSPEARPPIPLPKRGPAELKAIKDLGPKSAFDSILLRDKTPIGDLRWSMIPRYMRDNVHESALLKEVWAYNPPAYPNELIRNVIPPNEFDRMVQRAAQATAEAMQ